MSKTSEAVAVTVGPWLKWAWYHYGMTLQEFDTFEDAVAAAEGADESLYGIEGPDGMVDPDEVERVMGERREARQAEREAGPKWTHGVRLMAPDTDEVNAWQWVGSYLSEAEAEVAAASLRERFGDRVSVKKYVTA